MQLIMTDKDFLGQLLTSIQGQVARVDVKQDEQMRKLEKIEIQTTKHNARLSSGERRVKRLEDKVSGIEQDKVLPSEVPKPWQDKKLIGVASAVIFMAVSIVYMLVTALTNVELPF